jgi:2-keto-4-pentenoate hydratase/2-oxohepta-3-ene-1,7-dioic acid hydratase in catechol pathway
MVDLIENITKSEIEHLSKLSSNTTYDGFQYDTAKVKFQSPIKRPIHDIICVGVNYSDHLKETKDNINEFQAPTSTVYFAKRANEIIGSGDTIKSRMDLDSELDYEVELAVIIGKKGIDIPIDQVEDYIFGYSVFNDISARKLQKSHNQWYRGKSLDTFSSLGPVILYKTALPFPVQVDVKTTVNNELRQSSNTKMFIADIAKIISEVSSGMTLEPGDIIATGTPSGVAMAMRPPKFLKIGDTVTCEIPEIGKLTNIVG